MNWATCCKIPLTMFANFLTDMDCDIANARRVI